MNIKEIKLNKKLIIGLAIIISLPLLILLCIKFTPNNKNLSKLNNLTTKIEDSNKSLKDAVSEHTIDTEQSESLLASGLVTLNTIKEDLSEITFSNDYSKIKDKTSEVLDYNIKLYEITLSILRNPTDKDITAKYTDFTKNYELLLSNYESLSLLGVKSNFPESAKTFFDNSSLYISTIIQLNRDKDILTSQKQEYISILEECLTSFKSINEDLKPALSKIKEDGRSLDVLLSDIREKKSKLNIIKNKSYSITIPEQGNTCYEYLQNTINFYELYITSLEHSIVVEKSSSSSVTDENIANNYTNSFSKYSDFITSLEQFEKEINEFK